MSPRMGENWWGLWANLPLLTRGLPTLCALAPLREGLVLGEALATGTLPALARLVFRLAAFFSTIALYEMRYFMPEARTVPSALARKARSIRRPLRRQCFLVRTLRFQRLNKLSKDVCAVTNLWPITLRFRQNLKKPFAR